MIQIVTTGFPIPASAYVFPVGVLDAAVSSLIRLVGSCVLVSECIVKDQKWWMLCTCMHLFQKACQARVVIPPHGAAWAVPQVYPQTKCEAAPSVIAVANPFADLVILGCRDENLKGPPDLPLISPIADQLQVGDEVAVFGYPFAPMGSLLETRTLGHVTALAHRQILPGLIIEELVLSITAHAGLSGGAVVSCLNGRLCGIVRGSLAPPPSIFFSGAPHGGNDSSVTFATSAHFLHDLIRSAQDALEALS